MSSGCIERFFSCYFCYSYLLCCVYAYTYTYTYRTGSGRLEDGLLERLAGLDEERQAAAHAREPGDRARDAGGVCG